MKFGQVDDPRAVDFSIPKDHPGTAKVLKLTEKSDSFEAYVGCAKWNRSDLKDFYPPGVKDELAYYSTQFNSIELNATFYRQFPAETFDEWYRSVPKDFRFFPKVEQRISHYRRLKDVKELVTKFVASMRRLRGKLEMAFLQLKDDFRPKDFPRIKDFVRGWKYKLPLAIEVRHQDWFLDKAISQELFELFETHRVTNVLVDTAGRRDLMHMRLTTPKAFIRWVGSNQHDSDRARLDEWVARIAKWKRAGLQKLYFFVHQNAERESPALAAYFIERLNKKIGTNLRIPKTLES